MAEKEALSKVSPVTTEPPSGVAIAWQSEKLELVKARDEAVTRANVSDFIDRIFCSDNFLGCGRGGEKGIR